jgi:hypothetical protein
MDKKGATAIEVLFWVVGAIGAVTAYAHMTFVTYREVAPRLDRIEAKIDRFLERGR